MPHTVTQSYSKPTQDEIAVRAFRIYESEGRPGGKAMAHWLQAEAELISDLKSKQNVALMKTQTPGPDEAMSRRATRPWQRALPREHLHNN